MESPSAIAHRRHLPLAVPHEEPAAKASRPQFLAAPSEAPAEPLSARDVLAERLRFGAGFRRMVARLGLLSCQREEIDRLVARSLWHHARGQSFSLAAQQQNATHWLHCALAGRAAAIPFDDEVVRRIESAGGAGCTFEMAARDTVIVRTADESLLVVEPAGVQADATRSFADRDDPVAEIAEAANTFVMRGRDGGLIVFDVDRCRLESLPLPAGYGPALCILGAGSSPAGHPMAAFELEGGHVATVVLGFGAGPAFWFETLPTGARIMQTIFCGDEFCMVLDNGSVIRPGRFPRACDDAEYAWFAIVPGTFELRVWLGVERESGCAAVRCESPEGSYMLEPHEAARVCDVEQRREQTRIVLQDGSSRALPRPTPETWRAASGGTLHRRLRELLEREDAAVVARGHEDECAAAGMRASALSDLFAGGKRFVMCWSAHAVAALGPPMAAIAGKGFAYALPLDSLESPSESSKRRVKERMAAVSRPLDARSMPRRARIVDSRMVDDVLAAMGLPDTHLESVDAASLFSFDISDPHADEPGLGVGVRMTPEGRTMVHRCVARKHGTDIQVPHDAETGAILEPALFAARVRRFIDPEQPFEGVRSYHCGDAHGVLVTYMSSKGHRAIVVFDCLGLDAAAYARTMLAELRGAIPLFVFRSRLLYGQLGCHVACVQVAVTLRRLREEMMRVLQEAQRPPRDGPAQIDFPPEIARFMQSTEDFGREAGNHLDRRLRDSGKGLTLIESVGRHLFQTRRAGRPALVMDALRQKQHDWAEAAQIEDCNRQLEERLGVRWGPIRQSEFCERMKARLRE